MKYNLRFGGMIWPTLLGCLIFGGGSVLIFLLAVLARCLGDLQIELNQAKVLSATSLPVATEVYDRYGEKIGEFGGERRYYVKLGDLPPHVIQAFVSAEDKFFYLHGGLDWQAVVRSAMINLRGGGFRQGASTITQQLARLSFLDGSKRIERKIKEAVLALAIESRLSKSQILELYLNKIYLGQRSYGIEAAARNYFRKHARDLSIGEAAMLAGLPKAPSRYAPHKNLKRARERQAFVLRRMREDGFITEAEAARWQENKLRVARQPEHYGDKAPYFVQAVQRDIKRSLGLDSLAHAGLKIYTTLDLALQNAARHALTRSIQALDRDPLSRGRFEGAIFCVEPNTGAVLAMQGGMSFGISQFNRSLYSKRRLGLTFAPIYLGLAFDRGFTLTSPVGKDPYSGGQAKMLIDGQSIYQSLIEGRLENLLPVYAALGSGTVAEHSQSLGLDFGRDDLTIGLGYGEASAAQVATAFAVMAAKGVKHRPYLVTRIESREGRVLYRSKASAKPPSRILTPEAAFVAQHLLRDKLQHDLKKYGMPLLRGKSGLAAANDDLHDAWFVGGSDKLTVAVWLGAELGQARIAANNDAAARLSLQIGAQLLRAAPARYHNPIVSDLPPPKIAFVPLLNQAAPDGKARTSLPFVVGTEPRVAVGARPRRL